MRVKHAMLTVVLLLLSLCIVLPSWAGPVTRVQSATQDVWMNGTSTLANNSNVITATSVGRTQPGYLGTICTLDLPTTSVAALDGSAVTAWMLPSTDGGTTYEDGGVGVTPARQPDMIFPLRAVATRQIVDFWVERVPAGLFKFLVRNDGTGATINSTWQIRCKDHTLSN